MFYKINNQFNVKIFFKITILKENNMNQIIKSNHQSMQRERI
jgi:hypothetical protein